MAASCSPISISNAPLGYPSYMRLL
jgi:hypothetical protein